MYLYRQRYKITEISDKILKVVSLLTGNLAAWFKPIFKDFINNINDDKINKINYIFESYGNFKKKLYFIYKNLNKKRAIV